MRDDAAGMAVARVPQSTKGNEKKNAYYMTDHQLFVVFFFCKKKARTNNTHNLTHNRVESYLKKQMYLEWEKNIPSFPFSFLQ